MAKPKKKTPTPGRTAKRARRGAPTLSFSRINAIYLVAGLASVAIGFFLLSRGSMHVAPILLVLGYCVLLPIGIIKK